MMRLPESRSARLAAVMIAVFVVGVAPSLGQTLLETHAHRQTQTAYTAVLYAEHGIDLLRPPLPILGPPGSIPQEFPFVQAAGAALIALGAQPDLAMRVVGLATFILTALLLLVLARRLMGSFGALVALGAFLFNGHAWLYGRSSLIEYAATAGGLAFLLFAIRWMEGGRPIHWFLATVGGLAGVLAKITTGGFYLLPALVWRSPDGRWGFQRSSIWLSVLASVVVGLAWSAWAQGVREETPASHFLSMENQLAWFFGSPEQRLNPLQWRVPLVALLTLSGFGLLLWGPLAVARARSSTQAPFILALLVLVIVVPLVLFNLYAIHDYYWAALSPVIALAVGLGAEWLRTHRRRRWVRRAMVGLAGAWVATAIGTFGTWSVIYGPPPEEAAALRIASFVRDHSQPADWVVLRGWGWNATFFYYARRQGLAVPEPDPRLVAGGFGQQDLSDIDFEAILDDPRFGPFIRCDHSARCALEEGP